MRVVSPVMPKCKAPGCPREFPLNRNGRPREYCSIQCRKRVYQINYRRKNPKRKRVKNRRIELGIDSETITFDDGTGALVLIACSDGSYIEGDDIRTDDALHYVTRRDGELWSFYGDYDINYWLRDLGEDALDILRVENKVRWGRWRIEHIPRRVFRVWDMETGHYSVMYDVFPFVQTSYVSWLKSWELAPPEVIERIHRMKDLRASFADESREDIRNYTFDEVRYLAKGVRVLKERIRASGFTPSQWLGPGAVASVALKRHRVKDYYGPETEADVIADLAYFGGRVETAGVGRYPFPVYAFDINSAYPAAMKDLPCLACNDWEWGDDWPDSEAVALVNVSWSAPPGQRWGPLPVRPLPHIPLRYPSQGRGWYWWHEVQPWLNNSSYEWAIHDVAVMPDCGHRPMEWVEELYEKRLELKAAGDPTEYAYKLILNSLYGKLAQSVGKHPYRNLIWAGIITSRTRARIGELLVKYPDDILIVATDGIYAKRPLPLELGDELGQWADAGVYEFADIWQPGFYFLSDDKVRTRGFTSREVDPQRFRDAWQRLMVLGTVEVSRRRSLGYRLAVVRHITDQIGRWTEERSVVRFDPFPRRVLDTESPATVGILDGLTVEFWPTHAPDIELADPDTLLKESEAFREWREVADMLDDGDPTGFYRD